MKALERADGSHPNLVSLKGLYYRCGSGSSVDDLDPGTGGSSVVACNSWTPGQGKPPVDAEIGLAITLATGGALDKV